ncbi:Methyltransferase domain-containing protein [Singulisphaera sp. GP187]|uniref:class I SAM-dependent methyltransferase n=1 Tax=Singulisphaera sp. GP187 TaxID=1882752 RepID=UPI000927C199|nr:class I SAM-dependent methyltransferase [Singulisphaera sp. GP187]SIO06122.1 Methyltransferase domain-containing protein [Singulisphaera sp. GP187]
MARQIILGLGAGQCGLELFSEILGRQPSTHVTCQQPPLLPWNRVEGAPGVRDRLTRLLATTPDRFIGDVASFYLPYVEQAVAFDPTMRMVCLKRPADEIVAGFLAALNQNPRTPIDHWSEQPRPPFEHHLLWSRTFPKYDVADRESGIRRYWAEYYAIADEWSRRFPEQFRVVDTEQLTTAAGVLDLLAFCGFPWSDQVVVTGKSPSVRVHPAPEPPPHPYPNPLDPQRCIVLVPFASFIQHDCDQSLKELERRGYPVRRVGGFSQIDQARNVLATEALLEGFEETLWIDSDIAFDPNDVEKLRRHHLPIVCGIYPQKGKHSLACHMMPGTSSTVFGQEGNLVELLYAATGFLLVRREAYLKVQRELVLPTTNEQFGKPMIPFFLPMIRPHHDGSWYLAEDYAFCQRARDCGFKIYADTTIRLWHIGTYRYGWEDAGIDRPRFPTFTLNFRDGGQVDPPGLADLADPAARAFVARHPWPDKKPEVPPPPIRNWLFPSTREVLERTIPEDARVIVEVGSFTGRSTRFLTDHAPAAIVIAIDHWRGSPEMANDPELVAWLPRLYETFLAECWLYRDRVIPVRRSSVEGLQEVAAAGLRPDVIFIDADHSYEAVRADLSSTLDLFPQARIIGDDWNWESVRQAVQAVCRERGLQCEVLGVGWRIRPVDETQAHRQNA